METSSRAAGSLGSCLEVHVQSCQRLLSTWQDWRGRSSLLWVCPLAQNPAKAGLIFVLGKICISRSPPLPFFLALEDFGLSCWRQSSILTIFTCSECTYIHLLWIMFQKLVAMLQEPTSTFLSWFSSFNRKFQATPLLIAHKRLLSV